MPWPGLRDEDDAVAAPALRPRMSWLQRAEVAAGAAIAFALPIVATALLAREQARAIQERDALELARSAVAQVENTVDQFVAAAKIINPLSPDIACTQRGLDVMRRIDLGSTLVQGVGWIEGDYLRCSSFAGTTPHYLGPIDYVSRRRARVRQSVPLMGARPGFVVIQLAKAGIVLHPELALSFVRNVPGSAVAAFSWSQRRILFERGDLDGSLLKQALTEGSTRLGNGHTLAISRSRRDDIAAIVILPPQRDLIWQMARQTVPAGFVIGVMLAALFMLAIRRRTSVRQTIRSALKNGDFTVDYQPIVDLGSDLVVGVEALLRWRRKGGFEISPDIFIPAAEKRGMMPEMTRCLFALLEQDVPVLLDANPDLDIAINLSALDLHEDGVLGEQLRLLNQRSGLELSRVILEATERALVDPDRASPALEALRAEAVRIAIDDFGTGYSSLAYLAHLEVDVLKIDKLFIQALGTGSATSQVAHSIIEMARSLGLSTVAEGVETPEQDGAVRELGIDRAQGYFYARPMPAAALADYLRGRREGPSTDAVKAGRAGARRSRPKSHRVARR